MEKFTILFQTILLVTQKNNKYADFYSTCDGSCKSYIQTCFMNSPPGQFKTWDTCPNKTQFKCPAKKLVLLLQFNNYNNYICGCTIENCEFCSSKTICDSCYAGYKYNSSKQACEFENCPVNYELDTLSQKCILSYNGQNKELIKLNSYDSTCLKCFDKNCKQCNDENAYSCKICNSGYFMDKGQCIDKCQNLFNAEKQCFKCEDINCESCNGLGQYDCTKCNNTTFLNDHQCIPKCPNQADLINRVCFDCQDKTNCLKCDSNQAKTCRLCSPSKFLQNGECVDTCDEGYFGTSSDNGQRKICEQCFDQINCKICLNGNDNSCLQCSPDTFLDNGKCVLKCQNDQFIASTKKCYKCVDQNCGSCKEDQSCQTCINQTNLDRGKCVTKCLNNKDLIKDGKCYDCSDTVNCLNCQYESQDYCTECVPSTKLENGICTPLCSKDGEFQLPDKTCKNCKDSGCNRCTDDQDSCVECKKPFYLEDKKCTTQCLSGLSDKNRNCFKCDDQNCANCLNSLKNTCIECKNKTYLQKGECVNECDKKEQYYSSNQECYQCYDQINCLYCDSTNKDGCKECKDGGIVKDGICVLQCGFGYFIDQSETSKINSGSKIKKCIKCNDFENCLECNDEKSDSCTLCKQSLFLQNGTCVQKCQNDQYDLKFNCYSCSDSNCGKCNGTGPNDCERCNQDYFLQKGKCVKECDKKQYYLPNISNKECYQCYDQINCLYCDSTNKDGCKECKDGRIVKDGICELQCESSYFIDQSEDSKINPGSKIKKCIKCNDFENCLECNDEKSDSCIVCKYPLFLENGKCVQKCSNNQHDLKKRNCHCFDPNCSYCIGNGPKDCRRCNGGFFQQEGECVKECEKQKYIDTDQNCFDCSDKNCKRCRDGKENSCEVCKEPKKNVDGYCKDKCYEKQYTKLSEDGSMRCEQCPKEITNNLDKLQCKECFNINNCDKCDGNGTCLECAKGWRLKNGDCVLDCGYSYTEVKNENKLKCELCFGGDKCLACNSTQAGQCNVCANGYNYLEGDCLQKCPEGYGIKEEQGKNICTKCKDNVNCQICSETYDKCEKCKQYYIVNSNKECIKDLQLSFTISQNKGEKNLFHINFNRQVDKLQENIVDLFDIKLEIQEAYKYKITYQYVNDTEVLVKFEFTKSYAGDNKAKVQYKSNKLDYVCTNPYQELTLKFNADVPQEQFDAADGLSKMNKIASDIAVNSIAPFAFSGAFAYVAMVVDITEILQLMEYTQTMKPWNLKMFYESLEKFNLPFWNVFQHMDNFDNMNDVPPGKFNEDSDISATFIRQAGEHFTITLICILLNIVNQLLLYAFRSTNIPLKVLKFLNKYVNPIQKSVEVLWTVYYDICLGFFLQLTTMSSELKYPEEGVNYTVTFVSISIIILPFVVAYYIHKGVENKIIEVFLEGYHSKYFWLFFYIRRLYCVLVVVLLQSNGHAQITFLILYHIGHLLLSIKLRPYEEVSQNIRNLIQSILMIVGTLMMYPLVDYEKYSDEEQVNFGWSQCAPFIVIIAIELLYFIVQGLILIFTSIIKTYKYLKQRKQVKPISLNSPVERIQDKKRVSVQSKIEEVDEEDSFSNHPPAVKRQQTEDIVLRNHKDDPLARFPTNTDEYIKTKQFTEYSPRNTKFTLQTEESAQVSPKKSSHSNFALESPNAETNGLFSSLRSSLNFSPRKSGILRSKRLFKSTLNEIEMEDDDKETDSPYEHKNIKINLNGNNRNSNIFGAQTVHSDIFSDSQLSPVKLDVQKQFSTSTTRIHSTSNINLIKQNEPIPRDKEKAKTILLKKIDDQENDDESPQSKPLSSLSPDKEQLKQIETKTFSSQFLESENNIEDPQLLRSASKFRKRNTRLQSILKLTKNESEKRNSVAEFNKADIQIIDLDEN